MPGSWRPLSRCCPCVRWRHSVTAWKTHQCPSNCPGHSLTGGVEELNADQPDPRLITAVIRGISLSPDLSGRFLDKVLTAPSSRDPDVLSAIAAKSWESLTDGSLAESFLRQLADNSRGQEVFNICMTDLLFLPGMREPLMKLLRDADRTPALSQAMGEFFRQITGKPG